MRIGIDASFLRPGPRFTGMGVYTLGLLQGLRSVASGHELHVLGYDDRPPEIPNEFIWHAIPKLPAGKATLWLSHQIALPQLARSLKLDVLHIPGVNVRLSQPGIPFFHGCPTAVTVHDAIPVSYYGKDGPALPWRLRWAYRLAIRAVARSEAIITVSETSRRDIMSTLPLDPRRTTVVHNGLPPVKTLSAERASELLQRLGVKPPYILYVGSYEPRKNVLGAIAAYARANGTEDALPPMVLVVERESGHKQGVMDSATASGVADRLTWLHSVSDDELAALYGGATAFIYPSFYEGFGFTPLQALAYGVPVIAGRAGAAPEVLGDAALLVDPGDTAALSEALARLNNDAELRADLRTRGLAQAATFTWEKAAAETLAVYLKVAGH